jgi:hypothetical protein
MNSAPSAEPAGNGSAAEIRVARLRALLFKEEQSTYAVLDGASIPDLLERLAAAPEEHACLYRGALHPELAARAPYLVKLRADGEFTRKVLTEGWGAHWGVFAITATGFEALRRHFRTFLRVRGPEGQVLYFRWYDPRVLRLYLPTCSAMEIAQVFGPVQCYVCEGESAEHALEFPWHRLRIQRIDTALAEEANSRAAPARQPPELAVEAVS